MGGPGDAEVRVLNRAPVHADAALLVLEKPSGLLAVPGRGAAKADCLAARAAACWPDALVVHRLDQATSGLMLFARGPAVQRTLAAAFAQRRIGKRYIAVVADPVDAEQGTIDAALAADWPNRPRQQVDPVRGRPSITLWRRLGPDRATGGVRLELQPLTGRSHQLRVHLASIGHPIVGDTLYAPPAVAAGAPRLLLHASGLDLRHPVTDEPLAFASAPPF